MSKPTPETTFAAPAAAERAVKAPSYRAVWIVFGVLAALLILIGYILTADSAPPDVSDLAVPRLNLPEAQNAYALLTKVALSLPTEPSEENKTETDHHFDRMTEGLVAWDNAIATAHFARYSPDLFSVVDQALKTPASEVPELKTIKDEFPEIGPLRKLGRILSHQGKILQHDGQHAQAAETNLVVLRLGHRIAGSNGNLINVLLSAAIQGVGSANITSHADDQTITPAALREYLKHIERYQVDFEYYRTAYKLEYVFFEKIVSEIHHNPLSADQLLGSKLSPWFHRLPMSFQPNSTLQVHAEIIRSHIAAKGPPPPSGTPSEAQKILERYQGNPVSRRLINPTGKLALDISVPDFTKLNNICYRSQAKLRLTQLYMALRLYHLEHQGALPDSLADLVPAYLTSIPLDPFDGQPLRYSRELTTIWSTDIDRSTFTTANDELRGGVPVYRLQFARPAETLPSCEEYQARAAALAD